MTAGFEFTEDNPGRLCQAVGTANALGQDPTKVEDGVWTVVGNEGDSQCYVGVESKVQAIMGAMSDRVNTANLPVRLIAANVAGGVSDGQLNGTDRMRFSLTGREVTQDGVNIHISGSDAKGIIAVVACDKPPVGTLAALLEHNQPAIIMSDGSIRPGTDPETGERIDIVSCFQAAGDPDAAYRTRLAMNACPGYGSCGGMFTYNTMQSFIAAIGMEPIHMVSPASEDSRRTESFPGELVDFLENAVNMNIRPRDIVTPAALRNGMVVAMAMGGSTNVVLHAPEIARAAGYSFWDEVMSQEEFNELSRKLPVLVNARPFGAYSMVDIDEKGGVQVIMKELLDHGYLDGSCMTCTGETLAEQIRELEPVAPDGDVIRSIESPFKETGGLRLLKGNIAPQGGAVIKLAGVEGGVENNQFVGQARVFNSEADLLEALSNDADGFNDKDMVVIRYEGPRGAPGMPEMLDPTSRISAICRRRGITVALMTDARFSGGSVGLVIGHVSPEASQGGPIALIEDGDTIRVNLDTDSINCDELANPAVFTERSDRWEFERSANDGIHPNVRYVGNRLLRRMRGYAATALEGAGISEMGEG
ncbi:dihydroxy-acid dehydratase [Candidatus Saccharibacteria bacterium]|nr:dihydroxy-acid dehydratase [Candidatus Saccharibacteria bacterium]